MPICHSNLYVYTIAMKKFFIYFFLLLILISVFIKFTFDPFAKSFLEKNLTKDSGRSVTIQSLSTNFFTGSISIENVQIKNDKMFSRENLITVPLIKAKLKISELFYKKIHFANMLINNPTINYDVVIQNGKMIDSFYLVENLSKNNSNKQYSNQQNTTAKSETTTDAKQTNNKGNIDFVIDRLDIPQIDVSILAKDFEFSKNISLDKMTFQNVGNIKNSNHYKDVMSMIVMNIAVKINNEVITSNLKKKFEAKVKNLLSSDKLKSIIGKDPDKVIKKLEKLFK